MTVTSSENRLRARLRRVARGAVVLSVALGLCGAGVAPASAADGDKAAAEEPQIDIFVSVGQRGALAPDTAGTATVILHNDGDSPLSSGAAVVEMGRKPLADSAAVSSWLESGELADGESDAAFTRIGGDISGAVAVGDTSETEITVPQEAIAGLAPGVYPVRAELNGAEAEADDEVLTGIETTSVLVISASPPPTATVLVPITATPENGALLTADELSKLTAADGALSAQLDGVSGTSAVLAVDPAIVAAIRVLGTSAPASALEWLDRLEQLPNERFALLFADADAATQAHAGLPALLPTGTLSPYLDPEDFPTASASPAPTPSPTDDPTANLPDDAALSAVPGAISGILWPRADVSDADLATFAGYLGGSATTILPSTSLGEQMSGHAARGEHELLITDAGASDALSAAAAEPDPDAREQWLTAAGAYVFLAAQGVPDRPLLVGLDRNSARTADALRAAVAAVDTPGSNLSSLRAAPATPVTLSSQPDLTRADALRSMLADEAPLTAFSSILDDPTLLLTPQRIKILRVIDVGTTARAFPDAFQSHQEQTQKTLNSVSILPSSAIQLFGSNADLAFWVRNDLPWPVKLRLDAAPTNTRLEMQRSTEAVAQPSSNTRIPIRVAARIGSGDLDVQLKLFSPTGVEIGPTQYVDVQVRADWEAIGLILFGGLAGLLIVFGVVRTVRRRRADADGDAEPVEESADTESDDDEAEADAVTAAPEEDQ